MVMPSFLHKEIKNVLIFFYKIVKHQFIGHFKATLRDLMNIKFPDFFFYNESNSSKYVMLSPKLVL